MLSMEKEKYVLISIITSDEQETMASLDELSRLIDTAGGEECGRVLQRLPHPDVKSYLGSGKVEELRMEVIMI